MENEITLKEAWIKLFGDNPVSWLKWFIVFIVLGLSFYILVYKVFDKIEYKTNIKRKIEKAQAKGNLVKGILIKTRIQHHKDSSKRTFWGVYEYEVNGRKYKYSTFFPDDIQPLRTINLYYINSPRKVFCHEEYEWKAYLGVLYLIALFGSFLIAGFLAKWLGLINV